jgi:hypothetical protein
MLQESCRGLTQTPDTTLAASVDEIALPADFYKLRGVDRLGTGGQWASLTPFSFAERNDRVGAMAAPGDGVRYRVQAGKVKLTPTDNTAGTYRIWYVPLMPELVADADVFDDRNMWSEYVVVDVAIKMLAKEESSTAALEKQKSALLKRIEDMSKAVDAGGPEVIVARSARRFDWWG